MRIYFISPHNVAEPGYERHIPTIRTVEANNSEEAAEVALRIFKSFLGDSVRIWRPESTCEHIYFKNLERTLQTLRSDN